MKDDVKDSALVTAKATKWYNNEFKKCVLRMERRYWLSRFGMLEFVNKVSKVLRLINLRTSCGVNWCIRLWQANLSKTYNIDTIKYVGNPE